MGDMMKARFLVVFTLLLLAAASALWARDWRTYTPLPEDISIEEPRPDQGLDPKVARLSGIWQGEWRWSVASDHTMGWTGQPTTIVVERISPSGVVAILSFGAYGSYAKGGWERIMGRIEGDRVVFKLRGSQERRMALRLSKENSAFGEWTAGGDSWKAYLERRELKEKQPQPPPEEKKAPGQGEQ